MSKVRFSVDSYKVEVVLNRNSLSMFKKFSWLAGYYQSFWGRLCQDPMILLLRKDVNFTWSDKCTLAFEE